MNGAQWGSLTIVWLVIFVGILAGASVGYTADSSEDLVLEFDGEELIIGNETTEIDLHEERNKTNTTAAGSPVSPIPLVSDKQFDHVEAEIEGTIKTNDRADDLRDRINEIVVSATEDTLHVVVAIGQTTAPGFYWISAFVPQSVIIILISVLSTAPVVGYCKHLLEPLMEAREEQ